MMNSRVSTVDDTRSSALPTETNTRPFEKLRQWQLGGCDKDGKPKIVDLIFHPLPLTMGRYFQSIFPLLPIPRLCGRERKLPALRARLPVERKKRDNDLRSLHSHKVKQYAGEAPPTSAWKPKPRGRRSKASPILDVNGRTVVLAPEFLLVHFFVIFALQFF